MRFRTCSYRHGLALIEHEAEFSDLWEEIEEVLSGISDDDIIDEFQAGGPRKSISMCINRLISRGLVSCGWSSESPIFADPVYNVKGESRWRLDFAKRNVSIEVAFNHGEAAAWNLLKPVLASELNHVRKAITTEIGVVITATEELKAAGGFDGAVGTFEKYVQYLRPLRDVLTVPLVVIGLEAPDSFRIVHLDGGHKKIGHVERTQP
ncbi:MAG: BglII/BstYI family type II restriction endonuclease [Coriobacteriales bacterium]|nr:hypothetical protein [Actinomycetes bacterium]